MSPCREFTAKQTLYLMSRSDPIMPVQLSTRVFTVHVHYNPNKTVLICLIYYRNETFYLPL